MAQAGQAALGDAALRPPQQQVDGIELLGEHGRPGLLLLGHVQRHHLLVVPEQLSARGDLGKHLDQFLQHLGLPADLLADRKTLAGEMPFAAQLLPRLEDIRMVLDALGEAAEAGHRLVDELPELGPVDLLVAVHAQLDLLPRPAEIADRTRGSVP